MPYPSVRISGAWKAGGGIPHGRIGGAWKALVAGWRMRWTLLSEEGEPTYLKEWVLLHDYETPAAAPTITSFYWDGEESTGGPYRVELAWTATKYRAEIFVYKWTGAWTQIENTVTAAGASSWNGSYLYYDGDQVYATVRFLSVEGSNAGAGANTSAETFTW